MFGQINLENEPYPQYIMNTFVINERLMLETGGLFPKKIQQKAFTIANKADVALEQCRVEDSIRMAFHAFKLYNKSADAIRTLARILYKIGDYDSAMCATREMIAWMRPTIGYIFKLGDGKFYQEVVTRPYIRALNQLAYFARKAGRFLLQVQCYEEILRLNNRDNTDARDKLICSYVTLFHAKIPQRTFEHLTDFFDVRLTEDKENIFGDDSEEVAVRWGKIGMQYVKGGNWQKLAIQEFKRSEWLFRYFNRDISFIPEAEKRGNIANGYVVGSEMDDARKIVDYMEPIGWINPQFVIDLHRLVNQADDEAFNQKTKAYAKKRCPINYTEEELEQIIDKELEAGREMLRTKNFIKAEKCFSTCRNALSQIAFLKGSYRVLSINPPFAVFSNRLTCAVQLRHWNLARVDARFLLSIKPDHARAYAMLPDIAEAFFSPNLKEEFINLQQQIKEKSPQSLEEWKQFAVIAIGLLSIDAIVLSRDDKLKPEEIAKFAERGIEDFYTPSNVSEASYPLLPYMHEVDLELVVP